MINTREILVHLEDARTAIDNAILNVGSDLQAMEQVCAAQQHLHAALFDFTSQACSAIEEMQEARRDRE